MIFKQRVFLSVLSCVTILSSTFLVMAANEFTGSICHNQWNCNAYNCLVATETDAACGSSNGTALRHCWLVKCIDDNATAFSKCGRGAEGESCVDSTSINITCNFCLSIDIGCQNTNQVCSTAGINCLTGGTGQQGGWTFTNGCTGGRGP